MLQWGLVSPGGWLLTLCTPAGSICDTLSGEPLLSRGTRGDNV